MNSYLVSFSFGDFDTRDELLIYGINFQDATLKAEPAIRTVKGLCAHDPLTIHSVAEA